MKKTMIVYLGLALGASALCGCSQQTGSPAGGINLANLDTSIDPGEDFYRFANGGWMRANSLPAEYARFGTFDQLRDNNLHQLQTLLGEVQEMDQTHGTTAQKIATLYRLGMDSTKLNSDGADPLRAQLRSIESVSTKAELTEMIARMHLEGLSPYFSLYVDADEKNSSMNIVMLNQGGIGLHDRDYYLSGDDNSRRIISVYEDYIKKLFTLTGYTSAQADAAAAAILKIERRAAAASYPREVLRDSHRNYNKMPIARWISSNKLIDWADYFRVMGIDTSAEVDVKQIDFFRDFERSMRGTSIADQKYYLAYNLIRNAAPYLSDDFVETSFDFHGRTMTGSQELQPRWKRALKTTDGALSEALGQLYVERYFPASSKEKMINLISNLQVALGQRINQLEWMKRRH